MDVCTQIQRVSQCTSLRGGTGKNITMQLTMVLNLLQYTQYKKYYANATEQKSHILMETEFQLQYCTFSVQLSYKQVYSQLPTHLCGWNRQSVSKN